MTIKRSNLHADDSRQLNKNCTTRIQTIIDLFEFTDNHIYKIRKCVSMISFVRLWHVTVPSYVRNINATIW